MRVVTAGGIPPEVSAYTLARYSRSADTFEQSLAWVRGHDAGSFLETFYFQYGHASIADLGHVTMALEGISEIAAIEVEDEQLWDGQAKSTRYQDFSTVEPVVPADLSETSEGLYRTAFRKLLEAYQKVFELTAEDLRNKHPRPDKMAPDAYDRAINARAFDVARYLLPLGIPTNVGQVTSIRTLEKQIQRLATSEYAEVRTLAHAMAIACGEVPTATFDKTDAPYRVAPTLAKYVKADEYRQLCTQIIRERVRKLEVDTPQPSVRLFVEHDPAAVMFACSVYPHCHAGFGQLLARYRSSTSECVETLDLLSKARNGVGRELPRGFRNQPFVFEITCDLGAYRDLHRHRRCQQFLQPLTIHRGYATPSGLSAEASEAHHYAMTIAHGAHSIISRDGSIFAADYIAPLGTHVRFLMAMDFAEVEYICRLRSSVKGHPSYRRVAWDMYSAFCKQYPPLSRLLTCTSPDIEEPLTR